MPLVNQHRTILICHMLQRIVTVLWEILPILLKCVPWNLKPGSFYQFGYKRRKAQGGRHYGPLCKILSLRQYFSETWTPMENLHLEPEISLALCITSYHIYNIYKILSGFRLQFTILLLIIQFITLTTLKYVTLYQHKTTPESKLTPKIRFFYASAKFP